MRDSIIKEVEVDTAHHQVKVDGNKHPLRPLSTGETASLHHDRVMSSADPESATIKEDPHLRSNTAGIMGDLLRLI